MSEYQVLAAEPRYKVDEFVDEVIGLARLVIAEMGVSLEALLKDMIEQFAIFKERHYLITFDDVRFNWIRWIHGTGQLVIEFGVGTHPEEELLPRHEVVDAFIDDVITRTMLTPTMPITSITLRNEFSTFLRGMIAQFSVLKKHTDIILRDIRFERIRWATDRQLVIQLSYQGRPFTPQEARW